jgi:hypothetical protein
MAFRQQRIAQMGAEKPCGASHQNAIGKYVLPVECENTAS